MEEDEKMTNIRVAESEIVKQAQARQEPKWLLDLREQAFQNIQVLPLPNPDKINIENWNFAIQSVSADESIEIPTDLKALWENDDHNVLVLYKDQIVYQKTENILEQSGVIFTSLFDGLRNHEALIQSHLLQRAIKSDTNKLTALHTACLNTGAFVYIPKDVVIQTPLHIVFLQKGNEAFHNHVLFVADTNSQVSYVETTFSIEETEEPVSATLCSEIFVNNGAKVTYGVIDSLAKSVTAYINRQAHVERDGHFDCAHGAFGDSQAIFETSTHLFGEASKANTRTVTIGRGKQKQNFTVQTIHYGKHSEGFILNHGVGMDESITTFNGIGKIEFAAVKADAQQSSKMLMLSEAARGDANPILLIEEHDVMAGHAASVGKIDELQMYYLMSRGLPREEAERLIIHGFLAPVVAEIPIEKVRDLLVRMIEGKVSR